LADGLTIPGVTDRYKTNDLVDSLMEVERIPLKREEEALEGYKKQQGAWRDVNQKMSTLRESVKTLYSFENPFNNKLASSSEESAVTVDAGREAEYGSFKIDVIQPATADRFLSADIDSDTKVKAGKYTFSAGEKKIEFNWKGGKLSDFVTALNRRGGETIKASLIGISANKKSLLIESLKTGAQNRLKFENEALDFAKEIKMVTAVKSEETKFSSRESSFFNAETKDTVVQNGMPQISKNSVKSDGKNITVPPRSGFGINFPDKTAPSDTIEFNFSSQETEDITKEINSRSSEPVLPSPGQAELGGISIENNQSLTSLPKIPQQQKTVLEPIPADSENLFFIKNADGTETAVGKEYFSENEDGTTKATIKLSDFPGAQSLVVRNSSTGKNITVSVPESFDSSKNLGFAPVHAITTADDAKIKYEGITLTRPENDIDDVVPHITLHLHDKTEKTATVKIEPDKETAKDAIITFVGKYNQAVAEMTILSTNKPEVVTELDYLTDTEREAAMEKLGIFQGDFTLTNGKTSLQRIVTSPYRSSEEATITLLAQIGISTNASTGTGGYRASQMRGYLEVDEKKLDEAIENNLDSIKNLFGYDSDGDLIIDDGIALKMDKQLTSWVQSGGIISSKTGALDTRIKASDSKISRLQTQLDQKESELRRKYASMEGTLNSLEGQQSTLKNFANQNGNR